MYAPNVMWTLPSLSRPVCVGGTCPPSLCILETVRTWWNNAADDSYSFMPHTTIYLTTHSTTWMQDEFTAEVGFMTFIPLQSCIGWVTTYI
jgi:hypothetical protein